MTRPQSKWIPSLDGIRAVSILLVICAHATASTGFPPHAARRVAVLGTGRQGVMMFFAISGYLITTLLLGEEERRGSISIKSFYARRALRIWPVYYLFIAAVFFYNRAVGSTNILAPTFIAAATFTTPLWGATGFASLVLAHTWSLSVEEQFYLFWPLVLKLKRTIRYFAVPGIILLVLVSRLVWFYAAGDQKYALLQPRWFLTFPTNADSIMCGCLLALFGRNHPLRAQNFFAVRPALFRVLAVVLIYVPGWYLNGVVNYVFAPFIGSLAMTYLIGSLVFERQGITYQILNLAPMRWIGRLSYSLYIWQQPLLLPTNDVTPLFWFQRFPQNILCVFCVATISYFCVEKIFLKLKGRFST